MKQCDNIKHLLTTGCPVKVYFSALVESEVFLPLPLDHRDCCVKDPKTANGA